nr:MAG TPA: Cell cycle protein [Bacteriophage sp.]
MNKTSYEIIRNCLDKLINEVDEYLAQLDKEIAENEQRIDALLKAREELKYLESEEEN